MKMILKVLALPLLFIVTVACILGNLITNISSHVIALLLLVIAGCSIYCIVKALWTSLAILAGMGLAAILIIFHGHFGRHHWNPQKPPLQQHKRMNQKRYWHRILQFTIWMEMKFIFRILSGNPLS